MAEKRKDPRAPAEWNASARPDRAGGTAGARTGEDEAAAMPGSHFEGDFGAEELPRKTAGLDRDLESTDRDAATSREGYGEYRPPGGYGFGSTLPRQAGQTPEER